MAIAIAAFLGYIVIVLYRIKVGQVVTFPADTLFFKASYLNMAASYFERAPGKQSLSARFIPVIGRSSALARTDQSDFKIFMIYTSLDH